MRTRALVLALAVLVVPRVAPAQTVVARGGVDFTFLNLPAGRLADDTTPKVGLFGGAGVRFGPYGRFSLQVEALVARKRATLDDIVTHSVTMLEVPFTARYHVWNLAGRPLIGFGGGYVGRVLQAKETVVDQTFDLKDAIANDDVGAVVGAEWAYSPKLAIDGRYTIGTTKVYNTLSGRVGTRRAVQVGVTYKLF